MRILHLVTLAALRSGGLGAVSLSLAREQRSLGHESTIWSLDSPAEATEAASTYGFEGPIVTWPVLGPSMVGYSPAAERMAGSDAGGYYDILHQHSIWMANSRVTNHWRATFRRPTVVSPHGALEEYALKRSKWKKWLAALCYERKNLRLASCLYATSEAEATSFRSYGLRNPITVIPNGIPDAQIHSAGEGARFRERYSIPPDKRLILFISRLHPKKGLSLLFEAMAIIRKQLANWCLVVAGSDELGHRRELQLLSTRLGIEDLIQYTGPLWGAEKQNAFAAADLFVLPTHSEGFGIIIAEALGAGLPVVTTRGAPWQELLTHHCGWWVDVSTSAIRDALLDAIQRPKHELVEMGQRGKTLVAQKYTWSQVTRKSLMLYEWLLGLGKRPDFVAMD